MHEEGLGMISNHLKSASFYNNAMKVIISTHSN
jgi:hypothetical protein